MPAIPAAAIGPIIGAAGAIGSAGIAAASKKSAPQAPDISQERKRALGSFAEQLANEEANFDQARSNNGILLRPGGRPILFSPRQKRDEPLIFRS